MAVFNNSAIAMLIEFSDICTCSSTIFNEKFLKQKHLYYERTTKSY